MDDSSAWVYLVESHYHLLVEGHEPEYILDLGPKWLFEPVNIDVGSARMVDTPNSCLGTIGIISLGWSMSCKILAFDAIFLPSISISLISLRLLVGPPPWSTGGIIVAILFGRGNQLVGLAVLHMCWD